MSFAKRTVESGTRANGFLLAPARSSAGDAGIRRRGSLRQLTRLMKGKGDVTTVDLWSAASVARLVLKQADDVGLDEDEMEFVRSFVRLADRLCEERYSRHGRP
jgi:hypothetical protein